MRKQGELPTLLTPVPTSDPCTSVEDCAQLWSQYDQQRLLHKITNLLICRCTSGITFSKDCCKKASCLSACPQTVYSYSAA